MSSSKRDITFEEFQDGVLMIPLQGLNQIAKRYGLTSGTLRFRDFTDIIAEYVWTHGHTFVVMGGYPHIFKAFNIYYDTKQHKNERARR